MTLQRKAVHVTSGGSRHAFRRAGEHTVIQRLRRNSTDPVFNDHEGRDFSEKRFRMGIVTWPAGDEKAASNVAATSNHSSTIPSIGNSS